MRKITATAPFGLGQSKVDPVFSRNHFASATPIPAGIQDQIDRFMMTRVAGNVWSCPSSRDFWQVRGGKIIRLVVDEVDDGDSIPPASTKQPMEFLSSVLDDLDLG